MLHLDLWSDLVCPWCWLGHARLERALSAPELAGRVELRWRSFRLDPGARREPGDLRQVMEAKYGSGAFDSMSRRLTALGAAEGLDYHFERAQRVNTADAHRLVQDTQGSPLAERTHALVERLYRAYFAEGANLADPDELVRLATEVELDGDWAAAVLAGDTAADVLAADAADAREIQLTGVPAVTWRGHVIIPGAQDTETMQLVLARVLRRATQEPPE